LYDKSGVSMLALNKINEYINRNTINEAIELLAWILKYGNIPV